MQVLAHAPKRMKGNGRKADSFKMSQHFRFLRLVQNSNNLPQTYKLARNVTSRTCLSWSAKLAVEEFSFCLRSLSWIVLVFGVTMGVLHPGVFVAGLLALRSWQRSPKRSRKVLIPDPPTTTIVLPWKKLSKLKKSLQFCILMKVPSETIKLSLLQLLLHYTLYKLNLKCKS